MAFEGSVFSTQKEIIRDTINQITEGALKRCDNIHHGAISTIFSWLTHALKHHQDFECARSEVLVALQTMPLEKTFTDSIDAVFTSIRQYKLREKAVELVLMLGKCRNRVCFDSTEHELKAVQREGGFTIDGFPEVLKDLRLDMLKRAIKTWHRLYSHSPDLARANLKQIARELDDNDMPVQDPAILKIIEE